MSRLQPYRNRIPTHIIKLLDVSSRITLFLVGQNGPLSFVFKDRLENKYKTTIGADIKCSCSTNKNDHCIHSLYVLLKIFKVSVQNPIIWQASYIDSELSDLVAGKHSTIKKRNIVNQALLDYEQENPSFMLPSDFYMKKQIKKKFNFEYQKVQRMNLQSDSVCPICQQQMLPNMCLTYCKIGCGNNYHLQCLKVWVSHKNNQQSKITCPMCRQQFKFSIFDELKNEQIQFQKKEVVKNMHKYKCSSCGLDKIIKNVHKCILCEKFQLCQACYMAKKHIKHPFLKYNEIGEWQAAEQRRPQELKLKQFIDTKRQQNKNHELLAKLRSAKNPSLSLVDAVCNAYPYVSKYISDNIDPYRKLNIEPQTMQCQVCSSKRMIFLRRLPCQHFIDHECLKQRIRKGLMYCQKDGTKILKGYQDILKKQKQQEYEEQKVQWNVDSEFSVKHLEEMMKQQESNQRIAGRVVQNANNLREYAHQLRSQSDYNFVEPHNSRNNSLNNHQITRNKRSSQKRTQNLSRNPQIPNRINQQPRLSQLLIQHQRPSHHLSNNEFRISTRNTTSKTHKTSYTPSNQPRTTTIRNNNSLQKNLRNNIIRMNQLQIIANQAREQLNQIRIRNKLIKPEQLNRIINSNNKNHLFLPPFQSKKMIRRQQE